MAAYNDSAAGRAAGAAFMSCNQDGDRAPVEALANDTASPSRPAAERSGNDQRSVSVSPPSSGIDRDEEGGEPSVVFSFPTEETRGSSSLATSGNVRQASPRANGNLQSTPGATYSGREVDYLDENDDQAVSAAALLLLATSVSTQSTPQASSRAAGLGESLHDHPCVVRLCFAARVFYPRSLLSCVHATFSSGRVCTEAYLFALL